MDRKKQSTLNTAIDLRWFRNEYRIFKYAAMPIIYNEFKFVYICYSISTKL